MMRDFPASRSEIRQLALNLIKFLNKNIINTQPPRRNWSCQNFNLLERFFGKGGLGLDCFSHDTKGEFLWDFVAYIPHRGNLLVAESEWDNGERDNRFPELEEDFDKLLYARSPIKLFMCRIEGSEHAKRICASLQKNVEGNCTYYSPAEIIIVYCVWWATEDGVNRDIAYILQIDGEPAYQPIGGERFEIVTK